MQVAAQAARAGHGTVAQAPRDRVDRAKAQAKAAPRRSRTAGHPLRQPRGELAGLLSVEYSKTRLFDMALRGTVADGLLRVVREHRRRALLRYHGFAPQRKLLLVGPPGTGKTMTAAALAGELGLPMFTVQLDGLFTKFLGETAARLRLVFSAIAETRGVYLFDELDALASERGVGNDVGEVRRILNSFLQFLELDDSDSLLVGATNHVDLLDRALFRRFDSVLAYALPTPDVATEAMKARLSLLDTTAVDWSAATASAHGLSHAELTRASEQAAKDALLHDTTGIDTRGLVQALDERRTMRR